MCGNLKVSSVSVFENPNRGQTQRLGFRDFLETEIEQPPFSRLFNNGFTVMMMKKTETGISCSSTLQTEINEDNKL
jgi:hypothetical protein